MAKTEITKLSCVTLEKHQLWKVYDGTNQESLFTVDSAEAADRFEKKGFHTKQLFSVVDLDAKPVTVDNIDRMVDAVTKVTAMGVAPLGTPLWATLVLSIMMSPSRETLPELTVSLPLHLARKCFESVRFLSNIRCHPNRHELLNRNELAEADYLIGYWDAPFTTAKRVKAFILRSAQPNSYRKAASNLRYAAADYNTFSPRLIHAVEEAANLLDAHAEE